MRKCSTFFTLLISIIFFALPLLAGETGEYVNGIEGIKAASAPPPGMYYKMYNQYYTADKMYDKDGENISALDFDLNVFANVHRFAWSTKQQLLGGNLLLEAIVPLVYTSIEIKPLVDKDTQFALGDIILGPALGWHGERWDAIAGVSLIAPTGKYDINEAASAGKDMWSGLATFGGTVYFDQEKTWTASALARYETHTEKKDAEIKPGDNFSFEWGIGKKLAKIFDVGVAGYCSWQVTDDSGDGVNYDEGIHDSVFAVGPEVGVFIPPAMLAVQLRALKEFGAVDRSMGTVVHLSLTKIL